MPDLHNISREYDTFPVDFALDTTDQGTSDQLPTEPFGNEDSIIPSASEAGVNTPLPPVQPHQEPAEHSEAPTASQPEDPSVPEVPPAANAGGGGDVPPDTPHSDTQDGGHQDRPIDRLAHTWSEARSMIAHPRDALPATTDLLRKKIEVGELAAESPAFREDVTAYVAVRELLRTPILGERQGAEEADHEAIFDPEFNQKLAPQGTTMEELRALASEQPAAATVDYLLGKLESHTDFLATGRQPENWPDAGPYGLLGSPTLDTVRETAELVHLSIGYLAQELGDDRQALAAWYSEWLDNTTDLLLENGHVGLAAPLIRTAVFVEHDEPLVDKLTTAMSVVRSTESEDTYRDLYRAAGRALSERQAAMFAARNEWIPITPTPGGQHEVLTYPDMQVLLDRFEGHETVHTTLTTGQTVELPYTHFVSRTVYDYGTNKEDAIVDTQRQVNYHDLDDSAHLAVEEAWRAADMGRLREDTLPRYRRLGLGDDNTLHTVTFDDVAAGRRMARYPDHHGIVSSEDPNIYRPVSSVQPVLDTYLVVPFQDQPTFATTYRDTEPNIFGPGDSANAFWVSGTARIIVDPTGNPKYMRAGDDPATNNVPRWVIVPVRYCQVTEQTPSADPEAERPFF